jgi:hypothetical protein
MGLDRPFTETDINGDYSLVDRTAVPNPSCPSSHNRPSIPSTLRQATVSRLPIMTEGPTTPSGSGDQTATSSKYHFQSLLSAEVNVNRPAITMNEAYEIRKKVDDGAYYWPDGTPRSPTTTPVQAAHGTVIMYTQTPHDYHDKLGPVEMGFDHGMLDHLEAHFKDGSVFGERKHIQTTGTGDDLTATKVTIFYALGPGGTGGEWNLGIGFRPIESIARDATDPTGTFRPVSYVLTPVKIPESDRPGLARMHGFVSDTSANRPITSLRSGQVGSGYYPVTRTYHDQSRGGDDQQKLVKCCIDTISPQGEPLPGRTYLMPADIDKKVKEALENTTSFVRNDSLPYRPQPPAIPAPIPSSISPWPPGREDKRGAQISRAICSHR